MLSESGIEKYECNEFEAGSLNWRLIIYPNGKHSSNDVSVYLSLANLSLLGMNWEVNAVFSIFLQNQRTEKYMCKGIYTCQRFDALSPARGFSKFVSKRVLMDPYNGYLVGDSCVFGAEVYVFKNKRPVIERVSWKNSSKQPYVLSWTISKYSKLKHEWRSENFVYGDKKWFLKVYPRGFSHANGRCVSVFLNLVNPGRYKGNAKYTIRVKNQKKGGRHHQLQNSSAWFSSSNVAWGFHDFMRIADISDPKNGFLVEDSFILELELSVLTATVVSLTPS